MCLFYLYKKAESHLFKLNERLRELRGKCGYTQSQVAKLLNIDRSTYAYYETGKTRPDVSSLVMLAKIFNISIGELLSDESRPKAVAERRILNSGSHISSYADIQKNSSHIYDLAPEEKELVGAFRSCSTEEQKKIIEYISNIVIKHGKPLEREKK
ncbi:MAG TPA: transcriptional regulator [Ruminococcaceae bacterium]|jgi:transcriptional regulator with XRE-family HTH domain|nr:transcriptional regulator [Oscillospiraceae bacterium]